MSRTSNETLHSYTAKVHTNRGVHRCNVTATNNLDAIIKAGLMYADEEPVSVNVTILTTIRMRGSKLN